MKKKKPYNKAHGRTYKSDKIYNKQTVHDRVKRNAARAEMKDFLTKKYGAVKAASMMKGMDVDHKRELRQGGSNNITNLRLVKSSVNRSRRDHKSVRRKS